MPIVLKSGSLNLLEPSGPVQACNGIALPLPFMKGILIVDSYVVRVAMFMKPAERFLQLWALVIVVLNIQVLLPES